MKYCRFVFENQAFYGVVENRAGELWIVDLADAPEEDLACRLAHEKAQRHGASISSRCH